MATNLPSEAKRVQEAMGTYPTSTAIKTSTSMAQPAELAAGRRYLDTVGRLRQTGHLVAKAQLIPGCTKAIAGSEAASHIFFHHEILSAGCVGVENSLITGSVSLRGTSERLAVGIAFQTNKESNSFVFEQGCLETTGRSGRSGRKSVTALIQCRRKQEHENNQQRP